MPPKTRSQHDPELGYLEAFQNGASELRTPRHLVDIVKANAEISSFLRLPSEIRNRIYGYAVQPRNGNGSMRVTTSSFAARKHRVAFHLLRVCRQIYSETRTVVHAKYPLDFDSLGDLFSWFERRNKVQREAIGEIVATVWIAGDLEMAFEGYKSALAHKVPQLEWKIQPHRVGGGYQNYILRGKMA